MGPWTKIAVISPVPKLIMISYTLGSWSSDFHIGSLLFSVRDITVGKAKRNL